MDLVEYKLLIVSVFSEQVTLSNATVLDSAGKDRIDESAFASATQTLFAKTPSSIIPRGSPSRLTSI